MRDSVLRTRSGELSPGRTALVLALALTALVWPMLLNGGPILFFDSLAYLHQGAKAVDAILALLSGAAEGGGDGPGGGLAAVRDEVAALRSAPYTLFAYIASLPFGAAGPILFQAVALLICVAALAEREIEAPARDLALAGGFLLLFTSAPWVVSYLMPDVWGAVLVLYAMILVRTFDRLGWVMRLLLFGLATFATLSHYGNIPFAAALLGAAAGLRLLQGRLTAVAAAAAAGPVLATLVLNLGGGAAAFKETSIAPQRLPLLLARSIEDGPARWWLEDACDAGAAYAICEVYDEMPRNIGETMWGPDGLIRRASPDQMRRIRAEELEILRHAFLAYPMRQIWSLTGNAVRQLGVFGTSDFHMAEIGRDVEGRPTAEISARTPRPFLRAVEGLHVVGFVAALIALVVIVWRDGLSVGPRERELVLLAALALLANAAIFGGLSAPADRYGARIAWIVPLLVVLFALERRRQAAAPAASQAARRRAPRPARQEN